MSLKEYPIQFSFPSPVESVEYPFGYQSWRLLVKRDDLIHPIISGNKARKLFNLIHRSRSSLPQSVASMGGPYSNHLHALAYWCYQVGVSFHAIVRGERPRHLSATLNDIESWNGDCHFVSRKQFRQFRDDPSFAVNYVKEFAELWIPEGGYSLEAVDAFDIALSELSFTPDYIYCPVGSGTTFIGLCRGIAKRGWSTQIIGISAVRGTETLIDDQLMISPNLMPLKWREYGEFRHEFAGKGFGKIDRELTDRLSRYESILNMPLDPVYLVKTVDAILADADSGRLENKTVLLWHTGGLQGKRGHDEQNFS